jgi:Tfp pilus assembly protein PilP
MRNLGTLILLSAAAFAQTPTVVRTPAAPATVSVQPATTRTAQTTKPSPNGAKASATSAAPKAKSAVSVKASPMTKPATSVQKAGSVKPVVAGPKNAISAGAKSASTAPAQNAVSVKAAAPKSASLDPKQKAVSQASAGSKAVPAKSAPTVGVLVKPTTVPVVKGGSQPTSASVKASSAGAKSAVAHVMAKATGTKAVAVKPVARVKAAGKMKVAVATVAGAKVQESKSTAQNKQASTEIRTAGRRDPFLSPVVAMGAIGSGCSAGKRCLTIDQIALKGVVKSESGMIAVVTNSLDKAYFLRENDPVFNGYVVKITGDSIIFKETFHDRLGKALTRDVTKSITRPVA